MLTINLIREKSDFVVEQLKVRNIDVSEKVGKIISIDQRKRELQNTINKIQNELKVFSNEIGSFIKKGMTDEADQIKEKTLTLKEQIRKSNQLFSQYELELINLIKEIPNLPSNKEFYSVPKGRSSEDNIKIRGGGKIPPQKTTVSPHWELAAKYQLIDFELGNKLTGAGFPVYLDKGAILQRALINFFLDKNRQAGYKEVLPPFMVNEDSGFGTGQLPDKDGQMYKTLDDFYLIPTAEVPVTNIYRDIIIEESDLPIKLTAYTPCFRREAGSYGKDVRGLNRLHQFDKVEIVQIAHPDKSYNTLDEMVVHVEELVKELKLKYRIMKLCGGDMGFTSALTYDFEVFSAAQKRWLEVSSVSNFESFQANRLKLRFRDPETKKNILAHTLNGSALALPRVVAALLENNQTDNGIVIPRVLRAYTGFDRID